jgi:hypothetical protein
LTGPFEQLKPVKRNPEDGDADGFIAQPGMTQPSVPCFRAAVLLMEEQA